MSDRVRAEQAAAEWIAKRDRGPWTQSDADALAAWLEESAAHRAAYYRLNAAWQEAGRLSALIGTATPAPTGSARRVRPRWLVTGIAASLVLAVGVAGFLQFAHRFARDDYSTIIGGLQSVPLPDGSKITLNTNTDIRVAVDETRRLVELRQGEAFFEVASDPDRPFVVSAGKRRIVAVGTAFSVRREGDDVRVSVTEGKVRIEMPDGSTALAAPLAAGSVVRTARAQVLVQSMPIPEIEQALSWRSGVLTFRDTPLAEAAGEFNRYNTRQIVIADPSIAALEIGGVFRATNVDTFVQLLQDGFPVQASAEEDSIVLRSR